MSGKGVINVNLTRVDTASGTWLPYHQNEDTVYPPYGDMPLNKIPQVDSNTTAARQFVSQPFYRVGENLRRISIRQLKALTQTVSSVYQKTGVLMRNLLSSVSRFNQNFLMFPSANAEMIGQDNQSNTNGALQLSKRQFFMAAAKGDIETLREQLSQGQDINAINADGHTALHVAITMNKLAAVEFLSKIPGVSINAKNEFGMTALHWATLRSLAMLRTVLNVPDVSINEQDAKGRTALHYVMMHRTNEIAFVNMLIEAGANIFHCSEIESPYEMMNAVNPKMAEWMRQRHYAHEEKCRPYYNHGVYYDYLHEALFHYPYAVAKAFARTMMGDRYDASCQAKLDDTHLPQSSRIKNA